MRTNDTVQINPNLKLWRNGTETVIAESIEDVKKIIVEMYGEDEFNDDPDYNVLPLHGELTIRIDGGPVKETKTVAEWIHCEGPGHLCSTENY